MGWYPFCGPCDCKDDGNGVPPPEFFECTNCEDDEGPPILCVTLAGFTDGATNPCCNEMRNRTFWLPHVDGILTGDCTVGTGEERQVDNINEPLLERCEWQCALGNSNPGNVGVPPGPPADSCGTVGAGQNLDGTLTVVLAEGAVSGDMLLRVYYQTSTTPCETIIWEINYGAVDPDCKNWAALDVPLLADTSTYDCGTGAVTATLTARNVEEEPYLCCQGAGGDSGGAQCYEGTTPLQMQVAISGLTDIGTAGSCAAGECANLNGTYILDLGGSACSWRLNGSFGTCDVYDFNALELFFNRTLGVWAISFVDDVAPTTGGTNGLWNDTMGENHWDCRDFVNETDYACEDHPDFGFPPFCIGAGATAVCLQELCTGNLSDDTSLTQCIKMVVNSIANDDCPAAFHEDPFPP